MKRRDAIGAPEIAWHYTANWTEYDEQFGAVGLIGILASGHIQLERLPEESDCTNPASAISHDSREEQVAVIAKCKGAVPLVWFSTNQFWENTVMGSMPMHTLLGRGVELFRVGVATSSLEKWMGIQETRPRELKLDMLWSARKCGANPAEWYVSRVPVQQDRWVAIERFDGEWCALSKEQIQEIWDARTACKPVKLVTV